MASVMADSTESGVLVIFRLKDTLQLHFIAVRVAFYPGGPVPVRRGPTVEYASAITSVFNGGR